MHREQFQFFMGLVAAVFGGLALRLRPAYDNIPQVDFLVGFGGHFIGGKREDVGGTLFAAEVEMQAAHLLIANDDK
ncbi:hypothetical protein SE16_12955 [Ardenticatena maritima]|uniref:Uncharacterized protein n=1 Tax=Ardenticatena maritima TaxID=872965 RepID=A0A0P6Y340_9CHLR|nr:hypothetical protein SE16_12955 [Ardenticatena maritima]